MGSVLARGGGALHSVAEWRRNESELFCKDGTLN